MASGSLIEPVGALFCLPVCFAREQTARFPQNKSTRKLSASAVLNQVSENPEGQLANSLGRRVSVAPTQLSLLRSNGPCTKGGAHSNEAFSKKKKDCAWFRTIVQPLLSLNQYCLRLFLCILVLLNGPLKNLVA